MVLNVPFKKLIFSLFILLSLILSSPLKIFAIDDPRLVPNNIYGVHILEESDLEDAAKLVNSGGGDWGYVTLVIREDERDIGRWQRIFDKMRRLHLIPIIRVATRQLENRWEKPSFGEIDGWVSFLNSLNWVVKNRYVVIGNEPNHSKEWGGEINPEEYARYLYEFSKKLKEASLDFFVMPAGFDASAPSDKKTMREDEFLRRMIDESPYVFNFIDGWASHSYPNPSFSGSEDKTGRGGVRTFDWELSFLKSLGIEKEFPVFITETGWVHDLEGKNSRSKPSSLVDQYNDPNKISEKLIKAFNSAWQDPRIVAVTPFVLNYQEPPFDVFSWKKKNGDFYEFYYDIQKLPKIKGSPKQNIRADIISLLFPPIIPKNKKFVGFAYVQNRGQNIWYGGEVITFRKGAFLISVEPIVIFPNIEPGNGSLAILRVSL